mgnify:FL=1
MIKLKEIFDGWGNYAKDKLKLLEPSLKLMSKQRLLICHECEMRTFGTCNPGKKGLNIMTGELVRGCGCNLAAKTLSPISRCPLGKW